MAFKARLLQVIKLVKLPLVLYEWFLQRFVYPVRNEYWGLSWLVPSVLLGVVALLIGQIGGELVGGVAVAIVVILALMNGLEEVFGTPNWVHLPFMVWFMAAVFLVLLETPQTAVQMLTDPRVYVIMGGLLGGMVLLLLIYAFKDLGNGFDEWRNTRLRDRIAADSGMPAAVVDAVLASLDAMMSDKEGEDWQLLTTADAYNRDQDRRRVIRTAIRNQRRAERRARKAAK